VTRRDQTANGWRLDGAANEIKIRKKGSDQYTVTQTYPDLDTRDESKELSFHYTAGGVPWTVRFGYTVAFDFFSTIAKRQGPKTYAFTVNSSETLTVDENGNLAGNSHVNLTRAVMSFTCDDSVFKDYQLPYKIDPSSHSISD
jgi:hypothetical protein